MVIKRPIMVAELSINHLGMINIAKKMIDSATECGADLIKLKHKDVNKYYKNDTKNWRNFNFKKYRESLELTEEDFTELASYCKKGGVKWFCTVHDDKALGFIKKFDPPYYKVASMDAARLDFVAEVIRVCAEKQKPLIISLGGKTDDFTGQLVKYINSFKIKAHLLHTVSIYPTPEGQSNIGYINELKNKYENENIQIGYSGHESGYAPSLLAVLEGASMIERHFSLSRDFNIHHIESALTPSEFKEMVNLIESMLIESKSTQGSFHKEELSFLVDRKYE